MIKQRKIRFTPTPFNTLRFESRFSTSERNASIVAFGPQPLTRWCSHACTACNACIACKKGGRGVDTGTREPSPKSRQHSSYCLCRVRDTCRFRMAWFHRSACSACIACKMGGRGVLFLPEMPKGASLGSSFPDSVCARCAGASVAWVTRGFAHLDADTLLSRELFRLASFSTLPTRILTISHTPSLRYAGEEL